MKRKYNRLKWEKHTQSTKDNISKAMQLLYPKATIICKNCGIKKEVKYSQRTNIFCSVKCASSYNNKVKVNKYFRDKLSNSGKKSYMNGKKVYGGNTKWIEIETSNGIIKVQGSYEIRACKILDDWKKQGTIKNWEYTKDRIKYKDENNHDHCYLLDFKVFENDNSFYYIETKGFERNNDKLKWEAVRRLGFNLKIWYDKDLKKFEVGSYSSNYSSL